MLTENPRKYGEEPYSVVLLHGGPGTPGELAPVARELSKSISVLEPLQTKDSVNGQVEELKEQIEKNSDAPVVIVGYSWGAWLGILLAAKHPSLVRKLVLVGSGPLEESYAKSIMPTRLSRLSEEDRDKVEEIIEKLHNGEVGEEVFQEFGVLIDKADTYYPTGGDNGEVGFQPEIYEKVWGEASKLRSSGELLEQAVKITCPVVAIHGDYDPHPAEGVEKPLKSKLKNFKFILLGNCGHTPWKESSAREKFYQILRKELGL